MPAAKSVEPTVESVELAIRVSLLRKQKPTTPALKRAVAGVGQSRIMRVCPVRIEGFSRNYLEGQGT